MGRGRGKGKKQSSIAAREDAGSGDEEKLPVRRRGRPQKPLKDDIEEDEDIDKIQEEEGEDSESAKSSVLNKESKNQTDVENGRKRKKPSQVKENLDSVKDENGVGNKINANDAVKSVGFRQNGSRRKNKPRRAAEVGVECK